MKVICKSPKVPKSTEKVVWVCPDGHNFVDTFNNIKVRVKRGGLECVVCHRIQKKNRSIKKIINEANLIASNEGHKIIDSGIRDYEVDKFILRCNLNHIFKKTIFALRVAPKCPICSKKQIINLQNNARLKRARKIAKQYNGRLISKKAISTNAKLEWACENNHVFKKSIDKINHNKVFCYECLQNDITALVSLDDEPKNRTGMALKAFNRKKKMLIKINQWAKKNKVRILSKSYTNNSEKLLWCCKVGHEFEANWSNVKTGFWCPYCSGHKKKVPHIDRANKIAKERGGKCLAKRIPTTFENVW